MEKLNIELVKIEANEKEVEFETYVNGVKIIPKMNREK